MYADETGQLGYDLGRGASTYFGIGTATWPGEHPAHLWQASALRLRHAAAGFQFPAGYHAKNDTRPAREDVYRLIAAQAPRFDTTFLLKANAYRSVRDKGDIYLYRMAWYLHFKEVARQVTRPGDTLHVAVATAGTKAKKQAFQDAINDVCVGHAPTGRTLIVAHWDSASSWGLQVADYALWAVQRQLESGDDRYMPTIRPTLMSRFTPWGRA